MLGNWTSNSGRLADWHYFVSFTTHFVMATMSLLCIGMGLLAGYTVITGDGKHFRLYLI